MINYDIEEIFDKSLTDNELIFESISSTLSLNSDFIWFISVVKDESSILKADNICCYASSEIPESLKIFLKFSISFL